MTDVAHEVASARERWHDHPAANLQAPPRLALLIDGFDQPQWVTSMLRQIVDAGVAQVALVVVNAAQAGTRAKGNRSTIRRLTNWWHNRAALPYAAYRRHELDPLGLLQRLPGPSPQQR